MAIGAALPIPLGLPGGVAGWKMLQSKQPADFKAFSNDPVLKRDLAHLRAKMPEADTPKKLLADPRVRQMVMSAYGLTAQTEMVALMEKVLASDPDDATSTASRMVDSRYKTLARAFNYGALQVDGVPALPSSATFDIQGLKENDFFLRFSGTFGTVKVDAAPISGAKTRGDVAKAIERAFQDADGGRADITVAMVGTKLVLSDAKGRGAAADFRFLQASPTGSVKAIMVTTTPGNKEIAGVGGPNVTKASFIEEVVARVTQARFEEALGTSSETLRKAVYAKRNLPAVTNWYSVIADRPMAEVMQSALGLPASFGQIDVDKQVAILEKRFPIADLKDPAKLEKLLGRFVALGSAEESQAWNSASSIVSLFAPISQGNGLNLSGISLSALFSATR